MLRAAHAPTWVVLFTERNEGFVKPQLDGVDCEVWRPNLEIGAPSDYPWALTHIEPGLALAPWALQAGFKLGYQNVLCLNWDAQQRLRPNCSVQNVVEDWLKQLTPDLDLCTTDFDGTVVARSSDAAVDFIKNRQLQLLSIGSRAAEEGLLTLAMRAPSTPTPHLQRMALVGARNHDARTDTQRSGATVHPLVAYPGWLLPKRLQALQSLHLLYLQEWNTLADVDSQLNLSQHATSWLGRLRLRRHLRKLRRNGDQPTAAHTDAITSYQLQPDPWQWAPEPKFSQVQDWPMPSGINIMGYIKGEFGQGEASRSLVQACVAADIPFSITDLGFQTRHPQADYAILEHAQHKRFPIDLHYVNAAQEGLTAQHLHLEGLGRNRYTIGFWHWEQPQIPVGHWSAFDYLDEVWAPSQFVAQAVADVSPVPVFTIPHAIVCEASPDAQRANHGLPEGRLLVLVMYDFLSYQERKNPEAAIRAFRMASAQAPEIGLVIKTINGHQHPEALAALKASVTDLPHVFFVDDFLNRQQVWDLQACCDILLSLHRAEGFGLAPAEMMRLGKAVVATGWSANMDFMNPKNSMPVQYTLKPLAQDIGPYPAGPLWAEADEEHAAHCLLQLIKQPALRERMGAHASTSIRNQLSPMAIGQQVSNRLRMLGHWKPELFQPVWLKNST